MVDIDLHAGQGPDFEMHEALFAYDKSGALKTTIRHTDFDASIGGYRNEVLRRRG
jgi:hypothetical protein